MTHKISHTGNFDLRLWQHLIIFAACVAALTLRIPETVFHAQFWAEDGRYWYADAYNQGWWRPFLKSQDGYFQTFPRIAASLSLIVSFSHAPAVLNILAICIRALPVNILLSTRCSGWGNLAFRILMAGIYIALPNCQEISANVTNSQWVLALCLFLILGLTTPKTLLGKSFDIVVLLLSALTGPFCIFLFPISIFWAWKRKQRWNWILTALLCICCVVQVCALVGGYSGRPHSPIVFDGVSLMRMLGANIFISTLIGMHGLNNHLWIWAGYPDAQTCEILIEVIIVCVSIMALCLFEAANEMRLFIVFSAVL